MVEKIYILVEGCLDAALAEWLANKSNIEAKTEVAGGWTGVIKQLVGLAKSSKRILGIIDADDNIYNRINDIENMLRRYTRKRGLRLSHYEVTNNTYPPLLRIEIELIENSEIIRKSNYITFWCNNNPCQGTAEDIIREMLSERYGYNPPGAPQACKACPNSRCINDYVKYEPILFMAACTRGGGTLVFTPVEHHCGIDVKAVLDRLDVASTDIARRYQQLIRSITYDVEE